ncbi:MAG: hypothetical protein CVU44_00150 [Chloroflexi bacterium HGW-Chloroflexi-6]|nr:MAG: hypothetical protein CVU44_00150 [Chloroflexi bacterium HGW-Chloroflexi-6]
MISSKYREFTGILLICFFILFFGYLFFFDYVHPFVLVGVGAFLIIYSLFVIGVSIIELKRSWNYSKGAIVGIFLGIFVVLATITFSWEPFYYLKYQAIFNTFEPVCNGHTYPENPIFQENEFNSLVGIDPPNKVGKWSVYPIRLGWASNNPNDVILVACFQEHDIIKETCNYSGATVKRYQNQVSVELIEVRTGLILRQQVFMGTEPNECLPSVSGSGEIYGHKVGWNAIGNWLEGFVNPTIQ